MNALELASSPELVVHHGGGHVAVCNTPDTRLTVKQIEAMRSEPISKEAFMACITLFHERFDKAPKKSVIAYYYGELQRVMGQAEFLAAFRDLMVADLFFAAGWPYLVAHVQRQRDNGPDLLHKSMAETMGALNDA